MAQRPSTPLLLLLGALLWLVAPWSVSVARAEAPHQAELSRVIGEDAAAARVAVEGLKARGEVSALDALAALDAGDLRVDARGNLFVQRGSSLVPALPGGEKKPAGTLRTPQVDNSLRRALLPAVA